MKETFRAQNASDCKPVQTMVFGEGKWRSLVENSLDIISLVDSTATVLYASPSSLRLLGFTAEELVGRNCLELIYPDDRLWLSKLFGKLLEEPDKTQSREFRLRHKDGSYRWMESVASNRLSDPAVGAFVLNLRDITERKQTEAALGQSEERFSAFMDHLPGAAWLKDPQGRYLYANPQAAGLFSLPLHAILGRTDEELFPPETARQLRENDRLALAQGGSLQTIEVLPQPDGREHHSIVNKFAVACPENPLPYIAGVAFDISQCRPVEEAFRQSEGRLRMLAETLPSVPWSATSDGQIEYFTEKWLTWTGLTREQALGEGWKQVVHPEDAPALLAAASRSIQTGEPFDMEHRLRRLPGQTYRWYRSRALPERDPTGRIVRWHGITDDIHDLKTALDALKASECQLREKEQRLRLALETAALGSYERDLVANTVVLDANCREILGVAEGCVPDPQVAYKSLHSEDRERVLAAVTRAFDPARREICAAEFRILRPDGSLRWVAGRGRVIFDDRVQPARGLKFLGVLHDITERKRAEEALQNQNRQLDLLSKATANLLLAEEPEQIVAGIAEQLPEGLSVDGILQFELNDSHDELLLRGSWGTGRDMYQRGLKSLKVGEGLSGTVARDRKPLVFAQVQHSADPRLARSRKLGLQAYACYPLLVGERLLGTLAFTSRRRECFFPSDLQFFETLAGYVALAEERARLVKQLRRYTENLELTVEERTARLRETVAELEHISYSMVHDMRAPLRSMCSYAQILLHKAAARLQTEEKDFLERIITSAARMDQLVNEVLNYNKVLRAELPLASVDTGELLREVLSARTEFQPPQANILLQSPFPKVLANPGALAQCFTQFLENAVKFVVPGHLPTVHIRAETPPASASATPKVRLWFEDNGLGIPGECQSRIFDLFHQTHIGYSGTGIGLALVRQLIRRMGGNVGVQSQPGQGSRFWLELNAA